jgi:hypothetical protein
VNRKQWIAGAVLLAVLMILAAGSIIALNELKDKPGSIGHREPLPGFGYCSSKQIRPCVLAANSKPNGTTVISVLVEPRLRNFYIKIGDEEKEYVYTCEKGERKSIYAFCTGKTMPVGKALSFLVISNKGDTVVASGNFPIVGLALATPEIAIPTVTPAYTPAFNHGPK